MVDYLLDNRIGNTAGRSQTGPLVPSLLRGVIKVADAAVGIDTHLVIGISFRKGSCSCWAPGAWISTSCCALGTDLPSIFFFFFVFCNENSCCTMLTESGRFIVMECTFFFFVQIFFLLTNNFQCGWGYFLHLTVQVMNDPFMNIWSFGTQLTDVDTTYV